MWFPWGEQLQLFSHLMPFSQKLLNCLLIALLLGQLFLPPVLAQEPDPAVTLLNSLTVAEKIGQLVIVPFTGHQVDADADISVLITQYKVGGVVLQASNGNFTNSADTPRQIVGLTNSLQALALANKNIPLFVAIDQEGDDWPYTRITGGVTPIPSPMSIGATWNAQNARDVGKIVGQELASMGVNMLLGPVLDVLNDPHPTGQGDMGTRTFGGDPFWVGAMGQAYIEGVHDGSNNTIATVAKHFPGHGGSDRLPDNEVATVDKSLQELRRIELAPFFAVTRAGASGVTDALMSSHIRYRGFQGDIRQFTAPISFDAVGMATLLNLPEFVPWRNNGGLIISDALGVPAVRKQYDPTLQTFPHRRIAREAFLAGNDVLVLAQFDLNSIWSKQFENIKDTLEFFQSEYQNNRDFAARVDQSVTRILRLKLKLYPNPAPNALMMDAEVALAVSGGGLETVNNIARQSLTLLYPTPAEYKQRLARLPEAGDKILFVTDSRTVKECYDEPLCPPFESLPVNALENITLKLYGPDTTGQINPENVRSISFAELKQVLVGSLALASSEETEPEATPTPPAHSPEEVTALIQEAGWIIFATLDLNTDRYPTSDALKLFLAQGVTSLYNKNLIVLALNSPYYLDTTEVNKLTAYFGLYSKTAPQLEVAVRALFGEVTPQGASPVSVDGIGYDLALQVSPDPIRSFPVQVKSVTPENLEPPVTVALSAGPVLDHNGHFVPDGTPIEFEAAYRDGEKVKLPITTTVQGMVELSFELSRPGTVEISALSGDASSQQPQIVSVAMASAKPASTVTPTSAPAAESTPTLPAITVTAAPTALPAETVATSTSPAQANPPATAEPPSPAPDEPAAETTAHRVNGVDFLLALGAILGTVIAGVIMRRKSRQAHDWLRLGLITFIGGMLAYLLYGLGWIRPDLWLNPQAAKIIQRVTLLGMVVVFGLLGRLVERRFRW